MGYSVDGDGPNQPPNQQGNFADDEVSGDMGGWYASTELPGRSHGNDPKRGKKRQGLGKDFDKILTENTENKEIIFRLSRSNFW